VNSKSSPVGQEPMALPSPRGSMSSPCSSHPPSPSLLNPADWKFGDEDGDVVPATGADGGCVAAREARCAIGAGDTRLSATQATSAACSRASLSGYAFSRAAFAFAVATHRRRFVISSSRRNSTYSHASSDSPPPSGIVNSDNVPWSCRI
jgi:hypothetical protein